LGGIIAKSGGNKSRKFDFFGIIKRRPSKFNSRTPRLFHDLDDMHILDIISGTAITSDGKGVSRLEADRGRCVFKSHHYGSTVCSKNSMMRIFRIPLLFAFLATAAVLLPSAPVTDASQTNIPIQGAGQNLLVGLHSNLAVKSTGETGNVCAPPKRLYSSDYAPLKRDNHS
jgi:hypothetical protein